MHVCARTHARACVHNYVMLLLTCFNYNCNLFQHFWICPYVNYHTFSLNLNFTLMVCLKANRPMIHGFLWYRC